MTVFVENTGWVLDLSAPRERSAARDGFEREADSTNIAQRAVAVRMSFVGAGEHTELVGEQQQNGYHNYFLGNDSTRWRTDVPRYAALRSHGLYPGSFPRVRPTPPSHPVPIPAPE